MHHHLPALPISPGLTRPLFPPMPQGAGVVPGPAQPGGAWMPPGSFGFSPVPAGMGAPMSSPAFGGPQYPPRPVVPLLPQGPGVPAPYPYLMPQGAPAPHPGPSLQPQLPREPFSAAEPRFPSPPEPGRGPSPASPDAGLEEVGGGQRKFRQERTVYTKEQLVLLETFFVKTPYPTFRDRQSLKEKLMVEEHKIQVWFKNRRAKERRKAKSRDQAPEPRPGPSGRPCAQPAALPRSSGPSVPSGHAVRPPAPGRRPYHSAPEPGACAAPGPADLDQAQRDGDFSTLGHPYGATTSARASAGVPAAMGAPAPAEWAAGSPSEEETVEAPPDEEPRGGDEPQQETSFQMLVKELHKANTHLYTDLKSSAPQLSWDQGLGQY